MHVLVSLIDYLSDLMKVIQKAWCVHISVTYTPYNILELIVYHKTVQLKMEHQ